MKCQLCGYEFDHTQLTCHTGCPLAHHCAVICCPNCGYQTVDDNQSKSADWVRKVQLWWGKRPTEAT
jgi:hypothetical protein